MKKWLLAFGFLLIMLGTAQARDRIDNCTPKAHKVKTQYAKHHKTGTVTFAAPNVWYAITFDVSPDAENSFGTTLISGTTVTFAFAGHTEINGCLRPHWDGGVAGVALLACRIIYSNDNGATWTEARCLQATSSRERQAAEVGILVYNGSLTVQSGTQIVLQAQVDNTDLQLEGWAGFSLPVAASLNIFCVGK